MSTIRFTLIAVSLFVLTFAGISWASKGFPSWRCAPSR